MWFGHPSVGNLLFEADIRPSPRSRLRAKLLVFRNRRSLLHFWKSINETPLGKTCCGAVNALSIHVIDFREGSEKHRMEVDPKYFCVIGLVAKFCTSEIVAHESVHAGFAYAKRVKLRSHDNNPDMDEEIVCYPTGRIFRAITNIMYREGVWK